MFNFRTQQKSTLAGIIGAALLLFVLMIGFSAPYVEAQTPAPAAAAPAAAAPAEPAAETGGEPDIGNDVINFLGAQIMLPIAGAFLGLGGWLFDVAIREFILEMQDNLSTTAIEQLWTIVRDIVNLAFVFGFVYIGIRTIIDPGRSNTKAFLSQLIIAALLINFSLFLVRFITDVGNIASVEIYNTISTADKDNEPNIAAAYANVMGVSGIYKPHTMSAQDLSKIKGSMAFFIMASIFLIVAGFVFAAGAFLLFSRFVALTLLMIFSPLIFAAMVFPQLGKTAGGVLGKVINYSFFAPIYLFMLYLSFHILSGSKALLNNADPNLLSMFKETGSTITSIDTVLYFGLAIALLVASLQVAKMAGAYGGEKSLSMLKGGSDFVRKSAQGYAGRTAVRASGLDWASRKMEAAGVSKYNPLRQIADKASNANFGSQRSVKQTRDENERIEGVQAQRQRVRNISGAVSSGSAAGATPDRVIAMERAVAGASNEQVLKLLKEHRPGSAGYNAIVSNLTQSQHEALLKSKDEDFNESQKTEYRQRRSTLMQARVARGGITRAAASDFLSMEPQDVERYVGRMSYSQFDEYLKKLTSDTEKQHLRAIREREIISTFAGGAGAAAVFAGLKPKDAARLPEIILTNTSSVPYLTGDTLKQMIDADSGVGTVSAAGRTTIRGNITAPGAVGVQPSALTYFRTPHSANF